MENIKYNVKADRYQDTNTGRFVSSDTVKEFGKFHHTLKSMSFALFTQTAFLRGLYNMKTPEIMEDEKQTGLLQRMVDLTESQIKSFTETRERAKTEDQLSDPALSEAKIEDKEDKQDEQSTLDKLLETFSGIGVRGILTAGILGPFIYSFAKGFLSEVTDGLIELTPKGVLEALRIPAVLGMISRLTSSLVNVQKLTDFFGPLSRVFDKMGAIVKAVAGPMAKVLGAADGMLLAGAGTFLKKLLLPISILFAAKDAVDAFMANEGSMLEGIIKGLGAALDDFIGAPLDMLKKIIAFGLDSLGFEKGADWIEKNVPSFDGAFTDVFGLLFDFNKEMMQFYKNIFTMDWDAAKAQIGNLTDKVVGVASDIWNFFTEIFTDLRNKIAGVLGIEIKTPEQKLAEAIEEKRIAQENFDEVADEKNTRRNEKALKKIVLDNATARVAELEDELGIKSSDFIPPEIKPLTVPGVLEQPETKMIEDTKKYLAQTEKLSSKDARQAATGLAIGALNSGNTVKQGDQIKGGDTTIISQTINRSPADALSGKSGAR